MAVDGLRPGRSLRSGLDPDHVASLIVSGGAWPPVLVDRRRGTVIDGLHRLAAAAALGLGAIQVELFDGSEEDALVEASRRNVAHGLPLRLAERKAVASQLVSRHADWSDARLASI